MPSMTDFLAELTWRGLIQDRSEGLEERLAMIHAASLAMPPVEAWDDFVAEGENSDMVNMRARVEGIQVLASRALGETA